MRKIKAVIFDLDGTLADTILDLATSANYALECCGFVPQEVEKYRRFVGNGVDVMLGRASGKLGDKEAVARLKEKFIEHYSLHFCDRTAVYDNMPQVVDVLRNNGIKTAVVTNKIDSMAQVIIEKLYPGKFDIVCGQQDGFACKPDPTLTLDVISRLGAKANECIFIGDSDADMQTAKNSGCFAAGAVWGFRTREELLKNGADALCERPDELLKLIGGLKL